MPKSKELIDSDVDSSNEENEKPKKRARTETKKTEKSTKAKPSKKEIDEDEGTSDSNDKPESDGLYMLAKNRFISVSEFKGKAYVNIREYFEKDGKSLPGKKGISLSVEQWENLKKNIEKIDADLKK
ncbi:unnamed protein product [Brachionus calyciflorus]|uniref:Transcriptional coactivator p15 (PC4) C-terminal domain-containing protein n=1 Tax=Brachionus calyciflorus TaxID=104777 RepID=A0A813M3G3_9BILA|nr:unnamed protein product [Brachionus calyciflorus]